MLNEIDKNKVRKILEKLKLFIKSNGEEYKEMNVKFIISQEFMASGSRQIF